MGKNVDRVDEGLRWLRALGYNLAPLTGQDYRAVLAIDACWRVYAVADDEGRRHVWTAIVNLFDAMQPKCWHLGIELVARTLDWGDRGRMLAQLRMYVKPDLAAEFLCYTPVPR